MPATLEQRKDLDDVDAACEHADGVAVRGEKPVVLLQREDSSHLGSLLSLAGCEDSEGALPGQVDRLAVDSAAERHQTVQGSQPLVVERELMAAGFLKAAVWRHLAPGRGPLSGLPGGLRRRLPLTGGHID